MVFVCAFGIHREKRGKPREEVFVCLLSTSGPLPNENISSLHQLTKRVAIISQETSMPRVEAGDARDPNVREISLTHFGFAHKCGGIANPTHVCHR